MNLIGKIQHIFFIYFFIILVLDAVDRQVKLLDHHRRLCVIPSLSAGLCNVRQEKRNKKWRLGKGLIFGSSWQQALRLC